MSQAKTIEESVSSLLKDDKKLAEFEEALEQLLVEVKRQKEQAGRVRDVVGSISEGFGVPKRAVRRIVSAIIEQDADGLLSESKAITELTEALFG